MKARMKAPYFRPETPKPMSLIYIYMYMPICPIHTRYPLKECRGRPIVPTSENRKATWKAYSLRLVPQETGEKSCPGPQGSRSSGFGESGLGFLGWWMGLKVSGHRRC